MQGRRTGLLYAGADDYTLITPNYATSYTVTNTNGQSRSGTFREVIVNDVYYEDPSLYASRYSSYLGCDEALLTITNQDETVSPYKMLVIKDSFAAPLCSFLSTCCQELQMVDLRYYHGDVTELIQTYQPDWTLVMYSSGSLVDSMFQFTGSNQAA